MVRTATINDIPQILQIYNYYIKETIITFEMEQLDAIEMTSRFNEISGKYEWIVWQDENNNILGYAYYNSFRPRAAYQYSVESTVYLRHDSRAKGIGKQLYQELLKRFDKSIYRVILGTISLPNEPSVRLHELYGFKKVGHLESVGFKFGQWIDVGYWQLTKDIESHEGEH